jgi:hypothetical protein
MVQSGAKVESCSNEIDNALEEVGSMLVYSNESGSVKELCTKAEVIFSCHINPNVGESLITEMVTIFH